MGTQPTPCKPCRCPKASALGVRASAGVGIAFLAFASGCVSTGSVHATLGKRGVEASRLDTPATAGTTNRPTIQTSTIHLAHISGTEN